MKTVTISFKTEIDQRKLASSLLSLSASLDNLGFDTIKWEIKDNTAKL